MRFLISIVGITQDLSNFVAVWDGNRGRRASRSQTGPSCSRTVGCEVHIGPPILSLYRMGIAVVELRARRLARLAVEQLVVRSMNGYHSIGG